MYLYAEWLLLFYTNILTLLLKQIYYRKEQFYYLKIYPDTDVKILLNSK